PDVACLRFPTGDDGAVYAVLEELRDLFGKPILSEEDALRARTVGGVPPDLPPVTSGAERQDAFLARAEQELVVLPAPVVGDARFPVLPAEDPRHRVRLRADSEEPSGRRLPPLAGRRGAGHGGVRHGGTLRGAQAATLRPLSHRGVRMSGGPTDRVQSRLARCFGLVFPELGPDEAPLAGSASVGPGDRLASSNVCA